MNLKWEVARDREHIRRIFAANDMGRFSIQHYPISRRRNVNRSIILFDGVVETFNVRYPILIGHIKLYSHTKIFTCSKKEAKKLVYRGRSDFVQNRYNWSVLSSQEEVDSIRREVKERNHDVVKINEESFEAAKTKLPVLGLCVAVEPNPGQGNEAVLFIVTLGRAKELVYYEKNAKAAKNKAAKDLMKDAKAFFEGYKGGYKSLFDEFTRPMYKQNIQRRDLPQWPLYEINTNDNSITNTRIYYTSGTLNYEIRPTRIDEHEGD